MLKSEARDLYKKKRLDLSATERIKLDDLLLIQLQTVQLPFITFLLSYWPIEEIRKAIESDLEQGKKDKKGAPEAPTPAAPMMVWMSGVSSKTR